MSSSPHQFGQFGGMNFDRPEAVERLKGQKLQVDAYTGRCTSALSMSNESLLSSFAI